MSDEEQRGRRAARRRRRRQERDAEDVADGSPSDVVVVAGATSASSSALSAPLAVVAASCGAIGHLVAEGRLPLGIAAIAGGFFALIQHQRALRIAQVEIEPSKGALRFVSTRGGSASMSTDAIVSFDVVRQQRTTNRGTQQTTTYVHRLTAKKTDGGAIDVLEYPDAGEDAARRDGAELNRALARSRDVPVAATVDRVAALREISELEVEVDEGGGGGYREGPGRGGFSVTWSGRDSPVRSLAFLGAAGGMRLVFEAFEGAPKSNDTGLAIAQGFMTFIAAAVVVAFLASFWSRVTLSLDGDALTLVHRRFAFWVSKKTWRVADVRAVDLSLHGENLMLAVREADEPSLVDAGAVALASTMWARAGGHIPLGSLDVSTAMQIDVAFSEAIAERRGEAPGAV